MVTQKKELVPALGVDAFLKKRAAEAKAKKKKQEETKKKKVSSSEPTVNMGGALRRLRFEKGLSQEHLGEKLGLRQSDVSKLEKRSTFRKGTIEQVSKVLGLSVADFLLASGS